MSVKHPFLRFLKEGKIEFTKEGFIIGFHEGAILLPTRVFNKLFLLLKKRFCKLMSKILKEIGKYQVEQAIKRYKKIWEIDKLPKEKIWELLDFLHLLGIGKVSMKEIDRNKSQIVIERTIFAHEYRLEYGISKIPIDFYVCGMLEKASEITFGGKYLCKEVKCFAKGDENCVFVIKRISD